LQRTDLDFADGVALSDVAQLDQLHVIAYTVPLADMARVSAL
jgi:hypothetical protein